MTASSVTASAGTMAWSHYIVKHFPKFQSRVMHRVGSAGSAKQQLLSIIDI